MEWVITPKQTDSLIAMTFNEFGQIIASRENGPLILITDKDKDGIHDTVATYCDLVKNCQGMLAINGVLLAIGEGPQGVALYRLSDEDRDGRAEKAEVVLKFQGSMGETRTTRRHARARRPDIRRGRKPRRGRPSV